MFLTWQQILVFDRRKVKKLLRKQREWLREPLVRIYKGEASND